MPLFRASCGLLLLLFMAAPGVAVERKSILRNVVIESGETADDVLCCFCTVIVRGNARDDVVAMWGGIEIEGSVGGDAIAAGGGIRLGARGRVGSDAIAIGGPVEAAVGARIGSDTIAKPWFHLPGQKQVFWRGAVACLAFSLLLSFLGLALLGARRVYVQAEYLTAHPWRCFLVGLGLFVLVLAGLAAAEMAGKYEEPIESAVLILWALLVLVGFAGLCARLSRFLTTQNMLVLALVGACLFSASNLVPYLGLAFYLLLQCMAMGVLFFTRFRSSV